MTVEDTHPAGFPTRGTPGGYRDWWDDPNPVAAVLAEQLAVQQAITACREALLLADGQSEPNRKAH